MLQELQFNCSSNSGMMLFGISDCFIVGRYFTLAASVHF